MTSENFEKYLSLLKGFLKFRASQREEIATELRDHLEQRIEQLTEEGHSTEEAELTAIQEFGDAAGLAASFLNVTRLNRQRWIMRFTTFAIIGSFVGVLFIMSMWPQNGPVRLATGTAQDANQGDSAHPNRTTKKRTRQSLPSQVTVSKTRSQAEELAISALKSEIAKFEIDDLPLQEAMQTLSDAAGVPIIVSKVYLEDNGVDMEMPVTLKINKAKLSTVLEMVLGDQIGLSDFVYGVKDSLIFVAGEDSIVELMEVRVYDCKDFAVAATVTVPFYGYGGGGYGGAGMGGGGMGGGMGGGGGFFSIPSRQIGPTVQPARPAASQGKATKNQPKPIQGLAGGGGDSTDMGAGGMDRGMEGGSTGGSGLGSGSTGGSGMGSGSEIGGKTYQIQDLTELIDCLRNTIDADSWEQNGGMATLNQVGAALVIKQSIKNHDRVEDLLTMLRKAKK